jgi:hypothetical protein
MNCAKDDADIDRVIAQLGSSFRVKDLGPTEWLLGIKIERGSNTGDIHLSQHAYAEAMLEQFNMSDCHPVMLPGLNLAKESGATSAEEAKKYHSIYLSAVGSLMYLATQTCPDIAYTVGVLARFNSNPGEAHWKVVKHLFRYIKGTLDYHITYSKSSSSLHPFITYSDTDHGGCPDTGKSTGGYMVMMNSGPVSWKSKLQSTVSLSTTKADTLLVWRQARRSSKCTVCLVNWGMECQGLLLFAWTISLQFKCPRTLSIMVE